MQSVSIDELLEFASMGGLGAIAWDADVRLITANDAACAVLGLDHLSPGTSLAQIFGPMAGHQLPDGVDALIAAGPLDLASASGPVRAETRLVGGHLVTALRRRATQTAHRDLDLILEKLTDGVMVTDAEARIVSCNQSFRDIFGVRDEDCHSGMTARAFAMLHADMQDLPEQERVRLAEERAAYAEGRLDWPNGAAVRRPLLNGRLVDVLRIVLRDGGAVLTARDVTDEAFLRRETWYMKTMLDNMTDAVMMLDANGNTIAYNRRMLEMYKVDAAKVRVGMPVRDFIAQHGDIRSMPDDERDVAIAERLDVTLEPGAGTCHFQRLLRTGEVLEVTRACLPDGARVLTIRDSTADAELAAQKNDLETTLNSLTDAVLMIDKAGIITNLNQHIYSMFQIDPDIELRGMSITESIEHHGDIAHLDDARRKGVIGERQQVVTGAFHPTGNFRLRVRLRGRMYVDLVRTALPEGGAVFTVRDATESAELARQKLFLETMIENLDDAVMLLDARNTIVTVNRRMLEMFQMDAENVTVGTSAEDLLQHQRDLEDVGPLERATLMDQRYRIVTGQLSESGSFVALGRTPGGDVLETTRTALPIGGAVLTVRDKTKSVELARQRALFSTVVDHIGEGVLLVNRHGGCELMNDRFVELHGLQDADLDDMHITGLQARCGDVLGLPQDEGQDYPESAVDLSVLGTAARQVRRMENGRVLEITRTPLQDGGAVAMHRDVTAETDRHRLLEEARFAAEDANRMKTDFIASVTHELRTPMHGVLGMSALLEQTELNDHQRNCLGILSRSGQHMLELIDGLLTISTLETGDLVLDRRPVILSELVSHCVEITRPRAREKGLALQFHADIGDGDAAMADEVRLTQIVTNLVANAVKYTETGAVDVMLQTTRLGQQLTAVITVRDTGPGIPDAKLQAIFEKFYQMEETGRAEGVGLGLAIARSLTELMEGRLSVESTVDVGTTFTLTVPLEVQPPAELEQLA